FGEKPARMTEGQPAREEAFMRRAISLLAVLLLVSLAVADDARDPKAPRLTDEERKIFELTNEARKKEKLPPLKLNATLVKVARAHSANMAKQEKMAHELDGKNPTDRIKDAGYDPLSTGENVGETEGGTAEEIFKMWMDSPPHKANILREKVEEIGIGIARSSKGVVYYTQVFATPRKR
ncbi:MAG TPA: CAP domain-containing protein, partial [Gemmataceae bacterium]|nr:CAP domain-containing protein [Gemmataceae bacterium]